MRYRKGKDIIADNIYSALTGEYTEGITDLNTLCNVALKRILRKKNLMMIEENDYRDLTDKEKEEIKKRYARYVNIDPIYHRVYTARSGCFSADYIPEDLYACTIERFYTDRELARFLDNKCYYESFFANIRQPETIALRMNGYLLSKDRKIINKDYLLELIKDRKEAVVKKAFNSEGGKGIEFISGENIALDLKKILERDDDDLVIQEKIIQHKEYEALHPGSVNTLRIMSLISRDGVKIFKTCIRIGAGDGKVDNITSGGFFVGIDEDGITMDKGAGADGKVLFEHPDLKYKLGGIKLTGVDKAKEMVKKAHGIMAHCRIAAWDIAIDLNGEPVLIETNLSMAGIGNIQSCSGPLFGDITNEVLEEVFYKNGHKRQFNDGFKQSMTYHYINDNLRGIISGFYKSGVTRNCVLTNTALKRIDRVSVQKLLLRYPELSDKEKASIREYYDPYVKNVPTIYHQIYKGKSGVFYPDYIPEEQYICDITRYLSDRRAASYFDHKCYYPRLFTGIKQPKTIAMRINGIWLDSEYEVADKKKAFNLLLNEKESVYKAACYSEGGAGVAFLSFTDETKKEERAKQIKSVVKSMKHGDLIVQRPVRQYKELSDLHPSSVNTFRIVSLLIDNDVKILSTSLRLGVGDSKVDNGSSGGIYIGVRQDGSLGEIGALDNGDVIKKHPDTNVRFSDVRLTCKDVALNLVKKAHPMIAHFRLVSWDIAIDDKKEAVLIECNLSLGGSDDVQVVNGPFFGEWTKQVLDEVYHK